jgi:predicted ATPase
VRELVNKWLGSSWLKTPYEIAVRDLVGRNDIEFELPNQISNELGRVFDELAQQQKGARGTEDFASFDLWLADIGDEAEELLKQDLPADDVADRPVLQQLVSQLTDSEELSRRWADEIVRRHATLNELVLVDKRTETAVSHRDVGIGVSQVLPVLVMAYGSERKLLAIEQPEIHLHPALQAELADLFIQSALGKNKNSFILETHSEHLILRIMRRIRDSSDNRLPSGMPAIKPEDVSVLFVEPTKSGSVVRILELDSEGEFVDSWPGGFFEEGFRERFT